MKLAAYTVYARYALLILATKLASGGWLPPAVANEIAADPALVELVAGLMLGAATVAWYWASEAHKALKSALD
ncbi:glycoside hydrolase family 19 chitinase domain [Ruegeria phage vB_RpoS-V16]|uniref:glycoside hydrolase family 19 chitinase domain n=1 Tax=Ruegeria phage vB_RpoS-V16 TaxID=2218618 RepID=UPI000DCAA1C0|nr:glycoside hydrolase family 19 chitinase domain [Ruegeria phage vB_RpoS-V16]AWY09478.1 glycoside hydrolase family 19 chitinase domain [Ruegeria phage vB_RpoS-V16]